MTGPHLFPGDSLLSGNFQPVFPVPVIAGMAGIAALAALVRAFRGRPLRPSWFQGAALLLRLAAIAVIALLLLNPSETVTLPATEGRSVILIDRSASMTLASDKAASRRDEAIAWTGEATEAMRKAGMAEPLRMDFSERLEPVPAAKDEAPGQSTLLAGALQSLAAGTSPQSVDSVIVISDGCVHDRQGLTASLTALQAAGIQVSSKTVGIARAPKNAAIVSVNAPRTLRPKSRVVLPVTVEAAGFEQIGSFTLTVRDDEGRESARDEFRLDSSARSPASVERRLTFETGARTTRYTVELSGPSGEVTLEDNRFSFTIEAITSKLRVLMVEGTHVKRTVGTEGHWYNDIELMTTAWDATGEIEWEVLTPLSEYVDRPNLVGVKQFINAEMVIDPAKTFPKTREEIFKYDVMLISDVPVGNFSQEQMKIVTEWVTERGGGFLMGGGYTSFDVGNYDQTPWEKITPVDMLAYGDGFYENTSAPFRIAVPESVRSHPVWQFDPDPVKNAAIIATHPPFTGLNRVRRAKPGAIVLATRPEADNEPVFAAQQYGRGRSIAYLPDPNGGWARYLVSWGPPGGPPHGPHTEMGHGANFRFDEAAARSAKGPRPPHPSPYYARFWINVVKWLGENSIRWRRDKLAGRILNAQAQPDSELRVAAEVLAVTNAAELAALDTGARLDLPGSPRVRLTWDRDRREFTGVLRVPADFKGQEVRALFDVSTARENFTDMATAGVRTLSREYSACDPDPVLMAELAAAGGGIALTTPADAVKAATAATESRNAASERTWHQPLWTRWPWWSLLAGLLSLEWFLRRRGASAPPLPS